jgi:hypothetical protein
MRLPQGLNIVKSYWPRYRLCFRNGTLQLVRGDITTSRRASDTETNSGHPNWPVESFRGDQVYGKEQARSS